MPSAAESTYGPIFIGVVFNILLYGIMVTQTFMYFSTFKKDKTWMKLFVALLFLCDTLNCAFDIAFVYIPLVTEYGNTDALNFATWVFATDPAMTAIIALLVQMFFAWRVKVLTNSNLAVAFVVICSFCQWCGGMGTSIAVGMLPQFMLFQRFQVIVIIWLAFSALADTAITIVLVWHLKKHKTGFAITDDIVNRVIRLTVQTGLITALCAIIDLIAFLATPSGLHLVFNLPLSKLYTNSMMSSLNSRQGWRYGTGTSGGAVASVVGRENRVNIRGADSQWKSAVRSQAPEVFINVESHEMVDVDTKGIAAKLSDSASEDAYSISTRPSTHPYPEKGRDLSDTNAPDLHVV